MSAFTTRFPILYSYLYDEDDDAKDILVVMT
jgi:hypothetical protein